MFRTWTLNFEQIVLLDSGSHEKTERNNSYTIKVISQLDVSHNINELSNYLM